VSFGRGVRRRCVAAAVGSAVVVASLVPTAAGAASKRTSNDDAIEKRAVLKKTDLEAGWVASRRSEPEPSTVPACAGIEAVNAQLRPRSAQSPDFTLSQLTMINNSVVVLKSTKQAKRALEPYREPDAVTCLESVIAEAFSGPGIESVRAVVVPSEDAPPGADEAVRLAIELTANTSATPQKPAQTYLLFYDLLVVRVGRALTSFAFLNQGKPLPQQYEAIDAVVGRLEDAL
jgi:hypothetical protein